MVFYHQKQEQTSGKKVVPTLLTPVSSLFWNKSSMFSFTKGSKYNMNKIHLHDLIEIIQFKNSTNGSVSS